MLKFVVIIMSLLTLYSLPDPTEVTHVDESTAERARSIDPGPNEQPKSGTQESDGDSQPALMVARDTTNFAFAGAGAANESEIRSG